MKDKSATEAQANPLKRAPSRGFASPRCSEDVPKWKQDLVQETKLKLERFTKLKQKYSNVSLERPDTATETDSSKENTDASGASIFRKDLLSPTKPSHITAASQIQYPQAFKSKGSKNKVRSSPYHSAKEKLAIEKQKKYEQLQQRYLHVKAKQISVPHTPPPKLVSSDQRSSRSIVGAFSPYSRPEDRRNSPKQRFEYQKKLEERRMRMSLKKKQLEQDLTVMSELPGVDEIDLGAHQPDQAATNDQDNSWHELLEAVADENLECVLSSSESEAEFENQKGESTDEDEYDEFDGYIYIPPKAAPIALEDEEDEEKEPEEQLEKTEEPVIEISSSHQQEEASEQVSPAQEEETTVSVTPEPTTPSARSIVSDENQRRLERRARIIAEIIDTERTYVDGLQTIVNSFLNPIREKGLLPQNVIKIIFSDIEIIKNLNEAFLRELEEWYQGTSSSSGSLGKIFLLRAETFKLYTRYINNYDQAGETLSQMRSKKKNFEAFLEAVRVELMAKNKRQQELTGYLILPIQRIPRYCMLLQDLVKHTPEDHEDYAHLSKAYANISIIATYCNDKKKESESLYRLAELAELLKIKNLVIPTRRFLAEAKLYKVRSNEKGTSECNVYLFNDLIVCEGKGVINKRITSIHLNSETDVELLEDSNGLKNLISITNGGRTLKLSFNSEAERKEWSALLTKTCSQNTGLNTSRLSISSTSSDISDGNESVQSFEDVSSEAEVEDAAAVAGDEEQNQQMLQDHNEVNKADTEGSGAYEDATAVTEVVQELDAVVNKDQPSAQETTVPEQSTEPAKEEPPTTEDGVTEASTVPATTETPEEVPRMQPVEESVPTQMEDAAVTPVTSEEPRSEQDQEHEQEPEAQGSQGKTTETRELSEPGDATETAVEDSTSPIEDSSASPAADPVVVEQGLQPQTDEQMQAQEQGQQQETLAAPAPASAAATEDDNDPEDEDEGEEQVATATTPTINNNAQNSSSSNNAGGKGKKKKKNKKRKGKK